MKPRHYAVLAGQALIGAGLACFDPRFLLIHIGVLLVLIARECGCK